MRKLLALIVFPVLFSCTSKDDTTTPNEDEAEVLATTALTFSPITAEIPVGGKVTWTFQTTTHTVTFDDVAGRPADIPATSSQSEFRVFATAGTFTYHCSIHPAQMQAQIIVH